MADANLVYGKLAANRPSHSLHPPVPHAVLTKAEKSSLDAEDASWIFVAKGSS